MGRHKEAHPKAAQRYRPEKVSIGIELVKLPPYHDMIKGNKQAIAFYNYLGNELIASKKLATTDVFTLHTYCLQLSDYIAARAQVEKDGGIMQDGQAKSTRVVHPLARFMKGLLVDINTNAKQLGLTPYSRGLVGKVTTISDRPKGAEPPPGSYTDEDAELDLD